jgi:hypothetical protein
MKKILVLLFVLFLAGCRTYDMYYEGEYVLTHKIDQQRRECTFRGMNTETWEVDTLYASCSCRTGDTVIVISYRDE